MTRVHVFCEGQTEETFVREVLQEHFRRIEIFLNPIVLRTSATNKGGVVSYAKLKWQIENKCKEDSSSYVTTMIDFYGLPSDFPRPNSSYNNPHNTIVGFEQEFARDIMQSNFIANLLLHEYEALLFSNTEKFGVWFDTDIVKSLSNQANQFDNPELINERPETAPSKRIQDICRNYDKPVHGSLIAMDIGLDTIRSKCPHFDEWLQKVEALSN